MSLLGYNDEEDSTAINKRRCEMKQDNDPVLAAIDKAKWDDEDLDTFNITSNCDRSNAILRANTQIEAIRTAYLASTQKPSGPAPEYTEGICSDGAAILCDGVMLTISEVLSLLNTASADKARIVELEADKKELYEALEMLCDAVLVDMADKALKKHGGDA